jgi:hypothetical protein
MADESFRTKARARWDEIKDTMLEAATSSIEANKALIAPSADENFRVWDTLSIANGYQPQSMAKYNTYNEQVQYVVRFLKNRAAWIDENL